MKKSRMQLETTIEPRQRRRIERQFATQLLFGPMVVQRIWFEPPHGKNPPTRVGIVVPAQQRDQFRKHLKDSGYFSDQKHYWKSLGGAGKQDLYMLTMPYKDARRWSQERAGDPSYRVPRNNRKQAESMARELLGPQKAESPSAIEAAWMQVKRASQEGDVHLAKLTYSPHVVQQTVNQWEAELLKHDQLIQLAQNALPTQSQEAESIPVFMPRLDKPVTQSRQALKRMEHASSELRSARDGIASELSAFSQWYAGQPKQQDGSVVVDALVFDAARMSPKHLEHIEQARLAKVQEIEKAAARKGRRAYNLPSPNFAAPAIVPPLKEGWPTMHVVPVTNGFLGRLRKLEATPQAFREGAIPCEHLVTVLEDQCAPKAKKQEAAAAPRVISMEERRVAEARRQLQHDGFNKCRDIMLPGTVNMPAGGERVIGFALRSKSDWTQKARPLLEQMETARLIAKHAGHKDGMVLPTHHQLQAQALKHVTQCQDKVNQIDDWLTVLHESGFTGTLRDMQEVIDVPTQAQFLHYARQALMALEGQQDTRLSPFVLTLSKVIEERGREPDALSELKRLHVSLCEQLSMDKDALAGQLVALREQHNINAKNQPMAVSQLPLTMSRYFDQAGNASLTLSELQKQVVQHFTSPASPPLVCGVYLTLRPGPASEQLTQSDGEILTAMTRTQPSYGRHTQRENSRRACADGVGLDEFLIAVQQQRGCRR